MEPLTQLHTQLLEDLDGLHQRFLSKWIPASPEHEPGDFEHDLKAYCVLSHAAMEEFAEQLSMTTMSAARDAFQKGVMSRGIVALLASYQFSIVTVQEEAEPQERLSDLIRKGVDEASRKHGNAVHGNHGFSLKYLRSLLTPVGIDVPEDIRLQNALRLLADARGSFAHTSARRAFYGEQKRAQRALAPEDAARAVADCLELCRLLFQRALAAALPANRPPTHAPRVPWCNVSATWTFALQQDPLWRNA